MLLCDKHSSHVQFKFVLASVVGIVKVIRDSIGDIDDGGEDYLSFGVEMCPVHGWIALFADALVEVYVVIVVDIVFLSQPNGLVVVDPLPFPHCPLDFLCLCLVSSLLDLQIIIAGLRGFNRHILLNFFLVVDINGEIDEL